MSISGAGFLIMASMISLPVARAAQTRGSKVPMGALVHQTKPGYDAKLECEFKLMPSIPFTKRKGFPIELHNASGLIIPRGQRVPYRLPGLHLWQVWRNGDLCVVNRYDYAAYVVSKLTQGVNTHEAAELLFQKRYGRPIEGDCIASGERRTAFGETFFVNNKSGKRMGHPDTVEFGARVMQNRGEHLTPNTILHAADPTDKDQRGHQPKDRSYDEWQLELMHEVLRFPEGARLVWLYDRLGTVLRRFTPNQEARELQTFVFDGLGRNRVRFRATNLQYVFRSAVDTDGIYHAIWSDFLQISLGKSPESYIKVEGPLVIDAFIEVLGERLTTAERAELESIQRGFRALPSRHGPEHMGIVRDVQKPRDLPAQPIKL